MGVLACNREGCENIMCDRYSDTYGYICHTCFNELKDLPFVDIAEFMQSTYHGDTGCHGWELEIEEEFTFN